MWPKSGWKRAASYLHHRIARIDGTPYAIASGFACGAAVSFTPFVGLHFVIAAIIAWIVRGNIFTSAIGTAVGNPWTFPLIWAVTYDLGIRILGWQATDDIMVKMGEMFSSFTIVDLVNDPFKALEPFFETVFLPMLLGGVIIGGVLWIAFYWPIYKLVSQYKVNRLKRRQMKMKKGKYNEQQ
ncbi:MAG: DUF2062 domain-containing protein [Alphaproteobacteria bacterium]|nr:DUF2062 domain-containing protein [Alphaproteobacteria bacterium]HPF46933.1 DUF2062 domain-containing protein [Emcibacteraceae bacterium]HRW29496.1 DUF2062 domain-containing protein [Emcibacteraceae bacterium]